MIENIPKNIIKRHGEYRKYVQTISPKISRGKFWENKSEKFDTKIKKDGYQRKGKVKDYLPDNRYWPQYLLKEYYYHLIVKHIEYNPEVILDIGAGGGHLAGLFYFRCNSKIFIVDLPEMIVLSSAFFLQFFPQAKIILPHESGDRKDADIVFLLPNQTDLIDDNQVDLGINTASFMEMEYEEVKRYFALLDRCLKVGGYFFCSNKDKKITAFNEYPWDTYKNYQDVYCENSRFTYMARRGIFIDRLRRKVSREKEI